MYIIFLYMSTYIGTGGIKWIGEMDRQMYMYTDDLVIHVLIYFCVEFKNSAAAAAGDRLE
jgi:hypothetical protein